MDPFSLSRVFRRLLSHQTCSKLRFHTPPPVRISHPPFRNYQTPSKVQSRKNGQDPDFWQQRTDIMPPDKAEEFSKYPMVTADMLRSRRERPRKVKMFVRDFIEGTCHALG